MKSDIKLIFENNKDLNAFGTILFNLISTRKDWLVNCNFHSVKTTMYVCTNDYSTIINFINNNTTKYNYKVINR